MKLKLINFLLFQIGWFSCVWSAAQNTPWVGVMAVIMISAYHIASSVQPRQELTLLGFAALIGLIWESFLVWQGFLVFTSGMILGEMAPYWIVFIWVLFATTLNVSLRWLKDRLFLSVIFGVIGGPLAYLAGASLGAVEMPDQTVSLTLIGIGWAVLTPALMLLSRRFDGYLGTLKVQRMSYV